VALQRLGEEDPTFQVRTDDETGQTVISGMGELHLEVIVDRLKREFNVEAGVGRPQVAYRETIRRAVQSVEGKFIRQTGGSGQYGVVNIDLEPAPGEGFDFINRIKGGAVPSEFIPAVEKGIEEALDSGVKAGYPMVDVRATLVDGKYHDTDSSEVAFKIAGSLALKEAARRASPVLLEPIMAVEVVTPEEFVGTVRAAVRDVRVRDRSALVHAGTGHLHDAIRALRRGAVQPGGGDRRAPHRRARWGERVKSMFPGFPNGSPGWRLSERRGPQWRRRSSSGTSRTSTSARSVTSTTARRP